VTIQTISQSALHIVEAFYMLQNAHGRSWANNSLSYKLALALLSLGLDMTLGNLTVIQIDWGPAVSVL
jgi:hypothetical protein